MSEKPEPQIFQIDAEDMGEIIGSRPLRESTRAKIQHTTADGGLVDNKHFVLMARENLRGVPGSEIHPRLAEITFNFWESKIPGKEGIAVNQTGVAPNTPWALRLTGLLFRNMNEGEIIKQLQAWAVQLEEEEKRKAA